MTEKILFVDDEASILSSFQRQMRKRFDVDTALAPEEGLAAIENEGPYAVVVSDLRMPGMDGIQFLARVRERHPDSVRVMLTGNADIDAAIAAINEGNIFRFLTKPVALDLLAKTLEASLEQYRLVTAERELLEETLSGAVTVLTEVLALVKPMAFSQATRLRRYVRHIAAQLELSNPWEFEVAAMLSQIGCMVLPADILQRIHAGEDLSPDEQRMYASHAAVGGDLLGNIPRLELIAQMIARHEDGLRRDDCAEVPNQRDRVVLGAQVLKVAVEFDKLIAHGTPASAAVAQLRRGTRGCDPVIVSGLEGLNIGPEGMQVRSVRVCDLTTRMVLGQDVRAKNGAFLAPKGQEITAPLRERIRRFSEGMRIAEPIRVLVPSDLPTAAPTRHLKAG